MTRSWVGSNLNQFESGRFEVPTNTEKKKKDWILNLSMSDDTFSQIMAHDSCAYKFIFEYLVQQNLKL